MSVLDPLHQITLTGDGVITHWDMGVAIRYIERVADSNGYALALTRYAQKPRGVTINPPLEPGETVTVFFYSDDL